MRCLVTNCPLKRPDWNHRYRCPEPTMACEEVWWSIDPEDRPSYEQWAAEVGEL